jgi:hypothetical protein
VGTLCDLLGRKEEGNLRVGVQSFGGMASKLNQPEDESLGRWITEKQFDVYESAKFSNA